MTRAWILQSNPDLYDIDAALRALDRIDWRVPQHTNEIQPGDVSLIWRSGPKAGVVGIGRILTAPRAMRDAAIQDRRFVRGEGEGEMETRVTVRLAPVDFIPKQEVALIPAMAAHPIITGLMGTVVPLSQEQWSQLAGRLPEPPAMVGDTSTTYPAAFAWNERRKSMTPLPGGAEAANERRRAAVLASEIVRIVERLQEHEGAVTARDVYWNLTDFQQQFDRPTMDEIEEALTALSSPAIGVLRRG